MTNCKFRETIFCNHNHHYNISRHDIISYNPYERDEGPTWVPPPPPPKRPATPKKIIRPVPKKVIVDEPKPIKREPEKPKPPPKVPDKPPEKIKVYPPPGPGVSEKVEKRMIGP